jgi:hypothetical protein
MMMIYSRNNGKYICEGKYSFQKMEELLEVYLPSQVIVSTEGNIIKNQYNNLCDEI